MKIDYNKLKSTCLSPIEAFESLGEVTNTRDGIYIFKDNGCKVLGVAHLDTVLNTNHFHKIDVNGDPIVINAQLDDRLGAYALIHLLPSLGIQFDLLLTEGEESGRSTAAHFKAPHDYNWMFSFDRHGDDVVLYQYDSKDINAALESSKFRIGKGSFSDIAFLDHLGVKGFNVGTGYEGEHTDMSYANMTTFKSQVSKFYKFYNQNKDKKYAYKGGHIARKGYNNSFYPMAGYSSRFVWQDKDYDDLYCYLCGKRGTIQIVDNIWLCESCSGQADICQVCNEIFYNDEIMNGCCWDCHDATIYGEG